MDSKHILVVSNMYPSAKYPHYGIFVKNTCEILKNNGYNVKVISLTKETNQAKKIIRYIKFYIDVCLMYIMGSEKIVYVHYASHCSLPILIGDLFRKKKIIVNVHGNDIIPETVKDKKYMVLVYKLLKKADKIICPSLYYKNVLNKQYNRGDAVVYPSGGIDLNIFHPLNTEYARKKLGLKKDFKYVGYVSRIEKNKGWDIFLKVCRFILDQHKDIRFIVVGDGEEYPQYENLKASLNLNDYIIEYPLLSQIELNYIYNSLDIFIFPTMRKSEALGLVGLEAMACGVTTILPNKYGPSSYARDKKNCFLFETGSVDSLKEVLDNVLLKNNFYIKQEALKTAKEYSIQETEKVLLQIFSNI